MVGVHIHAEGALPDIASRRADQQRTATQRIHQRKKQRRDAENAGDSLFRFAVKAYSTVRSNTLSHRSTH